MIRISNSLEKTYFWHTNQYGRCIDFPSDLWIWNKRSVTWYAYWYYIGPTNLFEVERIGQKVYTIALADLIFLWHEPLWFTSIAWSILFRRLERYILDWIMVCVDWNQILRNHAIRHEISSGLSSVFWSIFFPITDWFDNRFFVVYKLVTIYNIFRFIKKFCFFQFVWTNFQYTESVLRRFILVNNQFIGIQLETPSINKSLYKELEHPLNDLIWTNLFLRKFFILTLENGLQTKNKKYWNLFNRDINDSLENKNYQILWIQNHFEKWINKFFLIKLSERNIFDLMYLKPFGVHWTIKKLLNESKSQLLDFNKISCYPIIIFRRPKQPYVKYYPYIYLKILNYRNWGFFLQLLNYNWIQSTSSVSLNFKWFWSTNFHYKLILLNRFLFSANFRWHVLNNTNQMVLDWNQIYCYNSDKLFFKLKMKKFVLPFMSKNFTLETDDSINCFISIFKTNILSKMFFPFCGFNLNGLYEYQLGFGTSQINLNRQNDFSFQQFLQHIILPKYNQTYMLYDKAFQLQKLQQFFFKYYPNKNITSVHQTNWITTYQYNMELPWKSLVEFQPIGSVYFSHLISLYLTKLVIKGIPKNYDFYSIQNLIFFKFVYWLEVQFGRGIFKTPTTDKRFLNFQFIKFFKQQFVGDLYNFLYLYLSYKYYVSLKNFFCKQIILIYQIRLQQIKLFMGKQTNCHPIFFCSINYRFFNQYIINKIAWREQIELLLILKQKWQNKFILFYLVHSVWIFQFHNLLFKSNWIVSRLSLEYHMLIQTIQIKWVNFSFIIKTTWIKTSLVSNFTILIYELVHLRQFSIKSIVWVVFFWKHPLWLFVFEFVCQNSIVLIVFWIRRFIMFGLQPHLFIQIKTIFFSFSCYVVFKCSQFYLSELTPLLRYCIWDLIVEFPKKLVFCITSWVWIVENFWKQTFTFFFIPTGGFLNYVSKQSNSVFLIEKPQSVETSYFLMFDFYSWCLSPFLDTTKIVLELI